MRKWTTRAWLLALGLVVLTCLPYTIIWSCILYFIQGHNVRMFWRIFRADFNEVWGFWTANWRAAGLAVDDGANRGG